jgi:predicted GIY-YIG superfamily endonuclease
MSTTPEAVYIMASRPRGALYVGRTRNLVWRTWEHRTGAMRGYTRRYSIKQLVWFEWHDGFEAAAQREYLLDGRTCGSTSVAISTKPHRLCPPCRIPDHVFPAGFLVTLFPGRTPGLEPGGEPGPTDDHVRHGVSSGSRIALTRFREKWS